MKPTTAKPEHEVSYQDMLALCSRHSDKLTKAELLAVAANMVGKLIALQDQRITTVKQAMEIVVKNLEHGNQQVLAELMQARKGNA